MDISWNITDSDVQKIKRVILNNDNPFTLNRYERNVEKRNIIIDKEMVIKIMFLCLLTSQQRSGPNSNIAIFLKQKPFPITYDELEMNNNVEAFVKEVLINNGLTRYVNRISRFFAQNLDLIENEEWIILEELNELKGKDSKKDERILADKFTEKYIGFGPKQSRNFLQALGLTKYEIPIDSRIINWLNLFGFPVSLSSGSLNDKGYYHFVLDGIQELCYKADVYPCILDAAIFSSYDDNQWTTENSKI